MITGVEEFGPDYGEACHLIESLKSMVNVEGVFVEGDYAARAYHYGFFGFQESGLYIADPYLDDLKIHEPLRIWMKSGKY